MAAAPAPQSKPALKYLDRVAQLGAVGHYVNYFSILDDKGNYIDFSERAPYKLLEPTPLSFDQIFRLGVSYYTKSGTDPEIFVADEKGNIIPAWKFLPDVTGATKVNTTQNYLSHYGKVKAYWDGVQAEFSMEGTPPSCHHYVTENVRIGLIQVRNAAIAAFPGAMLVAKDVVPVTHKLLNEGEERHVALGCAPSMNAYGIPPIEGITGRTLMKRFSGCHLHYSLQSVHSDVNWNPDGCAVMMDKIGGLMLTALGRDLEDPERRKYYGRPGEYRLPPGINRIEYRTPGSLLLTCPQAFNLGADMCRIGYKMGQFMDGRMFHEVPDVKDIILNCDADAAWKVIEGCKAVFEKCLAVHYHGHVTQSMRVLKRGIKKYLGSVEDMWNLDRPVYSSAAFSQHYYEWRASVNEIAEVVD